MSRSTRPASSANGSALVSLVQTLQGAYMGARMQTVLICPVGEDDGHLVTFTQNTKDGASEMRVYNAKTMSQEPVATVQLPLRCPSGFHCYHMSEEQYQAQAGML